MSWVGWFLAGIGVVAVLAVFGTVFSGRERRSSPDERGDDARRSPEGTRQSPTGSSAAPLPPAEVEALRVELRGLISEGRVIEAIKVLRDRSQMGLKEAKEFVEASGSGDPPLPGALAGAAGASWDPKVPPEIVPEIERLLAHGAKIEAIKLVRERTGMGLKEAKDFVESIEAGGASRA